MRECGDRPPSAQLRPGSVDLRAAALLGLVGAQDRRVRSGGAAGRVGTAGGVSPAAAPLRGAAGQAGHARVRAGVAAPRGLSARRRPRRRPGRRAPGGDRVRRRQAPCAVSPRPPAAPPRSGAVSAPAGPPAWPRPRPRTTWHSWGPSDDETDPVAGRPSQGPAPAHLFTRIRQSGAALCPGRPGLVPATCSASAS